MKNVTVSMEDGVADWARMEAARRNTSVSKMLGEILAEKMQRQNAYQKAMRDALKFEPIAFETPPGQYLTRDEIYGQRSNRLR